MMKYEKENYNFIPKDKKSMPAIDIKSLEKENKLLLEEKNKLLAALDGYEHQLINIQKELETKENEIATSKNEIISLENSMTKYEVLKEDLNKVDILNIEIETLTSQIQKLEEENTLLNEELSSSKQHVQMLYLMLLVLAIL